jgi:tRNA-uridine 2-sulfurtransferase
MAQVRYRATAAAATLIPMATASETALGRPDLGANPLEDRTDSHGSHQGVHQVKLVFDEPQFGITPGQAAVWYDDNERVLGGGLIL